SVSHAAGAGLLRAGQRFAQQFFSGQMRQPISGRKPTEEMPLKGQSTRNLTGESLGRLRAVGYRCDFFDAPHQCRVTALQSNRNGAEHGIEGLLILGPEFLIDLEGVVKRPLMRFAKTIAERGPLLGNVAVRVESETRDNLPDLRFVGQAWL